MTKTTEELKAEAKELGLKGLGNAKPETIAKKIAEAKEATIEPLAEAPEAMRREPIVRVGRLLKTNLMHNGKVYLAGGITPDGVDLESLSQRGII